MIPSMPLSNPATESEVKIVQFSDETKLLPDGSKVIYAESSERIIVYHKKQNEEAKNYVFNRKTGDIFMNNEKGNDSDKQAMIQLGSYFLSNASDSELVTVCVNKTS
jgi:hypothetical protein